MTISVSPGSELELAFTDVLANGQAVGRTGGVVVFCTGPLPKERARVRITAVKPKYAVAQLLTILETSGERVAPFCPVFGECGGCQLQHLAYSAQLAWKREVVRNALVRIGGFAEISVAETIGMRNPRAYRNKMSLVVDRSCERVGFYKQRSHDVVQIDGCPIVLPRLDAQIPRLNAAKADAATADVFARTRHVVARTAQATGEVVVTFTTDRPDVALKAKAAQVAAKLENISGLTNSYDLSGPNAIVGRKQQTLTGSGTIEESMGGLRYRVSSGSFFQVNVEILERVLERLDPLLKRPLRILDLYCGAGAFALYFAKRGSTVLGVEENALAVAEARENAALNGLQSRVRFHASTVEHALTHPAMAKDVARTEAVFLDPPRKGCEERALAAIAARRIPAIWYLSCDPATLARDLKFLAAKGYRPGEIQPFDMFPQTGHVETLALLARS
ncbi:MAG TPA: 23S rRNA (uracil(1939)-C(5))-methyltransferase RlmD [Candidatus Rubrimentiphilum sp.]|nr:23S rRNA (uracil(1939)-C(5))-methyltransferase RlmD [Candidatus Rubrimentiphilum sp.]